MQARIRRRAARVCDLDHTAAAPVLAKRALLARAVEWVDAVERRPPAVPVAPLPPAAAAL
jgi:hypothetical protein